uniref:Cytoskeleton associated protein 4 n=1 Tax=Latimeria chalumnae TaxID=7897 RepID=H3BC30_LATCH
SDDVAKKGSKGGKGGLQKSGIASKLLTILLYLMLISGTVFSGWYVLNLVEKINEINHKNVEISLQNQEVVKGMETVVQQVQSLKVTVQSLESSLKGVHQQLDNTNSAVKKGENEINRISEVLQKLQNEILRDLSDGIKDVKDAREKDFTSLEQTVEERLMELTKSINDNIAVFTEVQRKSQYEIDDIKSQMSSLKEINHFKLELKSISDVIAELHNSLKFKDETMESFKNTINSLESTAQKKDQEMASFLKEYETFKQTVDSDHSSLENIRDNISQTETDNEAILELITSLKTDLQQVKTGFDEQEQKLFARTKDTLDTVEKNSEGFEKRLQLFEEKIESINFAMTQGAESPESVLSKHGYEDRLTVIDQTINELKVSVGEGNTDLQSVLKTLESITESQESASNDMEVLKKNLSELQSTPDDLTKLRDEVQGLKDHDVRQLHEQYDLLQEKNTVEELRASVRQSQTEIQMLRTAVDSLVAYSVKIENNENNLTSMKQSLEDFRYDLDKMLEKFEKIQETI